MLRFNGAVGRQLIPGVDRRTWGSALTGILRRSSGVKICSRFAGDALSPLRGSLRCLLRPQVAARDLRCHAVLE